MQNLKSFMYSEEEGFSLDNRVSNKLVTKKKIIKPIHRTSKARQEAILNKSQLEK